MSDLTEAVKNEDRRVQLEAIRDYIARELEANLCNTCRNSRLRTGDQASLILRLQNVLAEIEALPSQEEETPLARIRRLTSVPNTATGTDDNRADPDGPVSGKGAQRRSGSRRPGGGRK